jgi:hypothetical protein
MERTTHSTPHGRMEPIYGAEGECTEINPGRGAEWADRHDRHAWGVGYQSAYVHLLAIPDVVHPDDKVMAADIVQRIEDAIERGGWTGHEWERLHRLHRDWTRRAKGRDLGFRLRGWQRRHTGHHPPKVEKFIKDVWGDVNG